MDLAVAAVFDSWNAPRAILYRRQERIPADLGTAVNIVPMVFGNLGMDSGTGVAFTRDPGSASQGIYGDYLQNAQGEDVVAGIRNTCRCRTSRASTSRPTTSCSRSWRSSRTTTATCATSSSPSSATSCGCCRPGSASARRRRLPHRHPAGRPGLIDLDEALARVTGDQLAQLMFPALRRHGRREADRQGHERLAGAAVGKAVFDSDRAEEMATRASR
jgi:pyruvate,orthophosphate dikinase